MTPSPKFQGPLIPVVCRSNRSKNMGQFVKCFFLYIFYIYFLDTPCAVNASQVLSRQVAVEHLQGAISETVFPKLQALTSLYCNILQHLLRFFIFFELSLSSESSELYCRMLLSLGWHLLCKASRTACCYISTTLQGAWTRNSEDQEEQTNQNIVTLWLVGNQQTLFCISWIWPRVYLQMSEAWQWRQSSCRRCTRRDKPDCAILYQRR